MACLATFSRVKENFVMRVAVYMGAHYGKNPHFRTAADELGVWLAKNGHSLVYGGGSVGLMGEVARAVLDNGGEVIGITPGFFITAEEILEECTTLEVVPNMSARRSRMIEYGEAYIALPGGMGTIDEISECMALKRLGLFGDIDRPIILYNIDGYYDNLVKMFDVMVEEDLYKKKDWDKVFVCSNLGEVAAALETAGKQDETRTTLYVEK